MIKRDFWEKVAEVWAKKEEMMIADIDPGSDDAIDLDGVENWDDLLGDIFGDGFSQAGVPSVKK